VRWDAKDGYRGNKLLSATFPVIFEIADADSLSEADALVEALIDLART
jgi:hypothetical protein